VNDTTVTGHVRSRPITLKIYRGVPDEDRVAIVHLLTGRGGDA
jgi:hypothetical protein